MKLYEVTFGMRLYLGVRLFLGKYSMPVNMKALTSLPICSLIAPFERVVGDVWCGFWKMPHVACGQKIVPISLQGGLTGHFLHCPTPSPNYLFKWNSPSNNGWICCKFSSNYNAISCIQIEKFYTLCQGNFIGTFGQLEAEWLALTFPTIDHKCVFKETKNRTELWFVSRALWSILPRSQTWWYLGLSALPVPQMRKQVTKLTKSSQ